VLDVVVGLSECGSCRKGEPKSSCPFLNPLHVPVVSLVGSHQVDLLLYAHRYALGLEVFLIAGDGVLLERMRAASAFTFSPMAIRRILLEARQASRSTLGGIRARSTRAPLEDVSS
jgi:hypothetical protein